MITNPIVPGLHPDSPVIRFGHQYVVATSTFKWFVTSMRFQAAALHPVAESAP
jgi:beta-xylosidase